MNSQPRILNQLFIFNYLLSFSSFLRFKKEEGFLSLLFTFSIFFECINYSLLNI